MARGRKREIRYWQRKGGGYFVTVRGEQCELALGPDDGPDGPTYAKAVIAYGKLLALETDRGTDDYLVSALANQYRLFLKGHHPRRLELFEQWGKGFVKRYGHLKVRELEPYHFTEWLGSQPTWGPTSKWNAARKVLACINWGVKEGHVKSNGLSKRVTLPEPQLRGKEARMTPTLCDLIVNGARSKQFKLFLKVMRATGCRPVELRMADVAENLRGDRLVFPWNSKRYKHKTAKTKRDRTIYLTPELAAEVREHVGVRTQGPVFMSPRKKAYGARNAFKQFERVMKKDEVVEYLREHEIKPETVTMYSFRHSWASDWLDSGRSIKVCADLMGTSVAMLTLVYHHPDEEKIHSHYNAYMAGK